MPYVLRMSSARDNAQPSNPIPLSTSPNCKVRLLCVALVQAFSPEDVEALAHASMLSDSTRWAVDEQLMVLCSDMMAAALYPDSGEEGVAELVQDASRSASGWEAELAAFSRRSMQPS